MGMQRTLKTKNGYTHCLLKEQEAERILLANPVSIWDIVEVAKKKRLFTKEELQQIERILDK